MSVKMWILLSFNLAVESNQESSFSYSWLRVALAHRALCGAVYCLITCSHIC